MISGCGNEIANGGTNATLSDCNLACTGDAKEICGAGSESKEFLASRPSNVLIRGRAET